MNTLLENFLWRFRYYLIAAGVALIVIIGIAMQHQRSQRALQVEAAHRAEQEKLQQEKNNRLAQSQAEQARLQREESIRLAKIQESERQKQAEEREATKAHQAIEQAKRDLKQQQAQKQSRYLAQIETAHVGMESRIAVVVADNHETDSVLTDAASSMAERSGFVVVKGLLKPEFVSDGLFAVAFDGKWDSLTELNLTNQCEFVALCQFSATTEPRPAFQDVTGASGKLHLKLFRAGTGSVVCDKEFAATAAGFQPVRALDALREKLTSLMATNTIPFSMAKQRRVFESMTSVAV